MVRRVSRPWRLSAPIARAVKAGRPVVALETTLITHGLPPPEGLRVAAELEDVVRTGGALPATIGILDGRVRVGLSAAELARLAGAPGVAKVNLSNLASQLAGGGPGSTGAEGAGDPPRGAGVPPSVETGAWPCVTAGGRGYGCCR